MASSSSPAVAADAGTGADDAHPESAAVLDALGDSVSREILEAAVGTVTVEELATRCDVSESTIYRRLDRLSDLGLVERDHLAAKGGYRTTMDDLRVSLDEAGFGIERGPADDFAEALAVVLEALDVRGVEYDADGQTVDVSLRLDDETFRTFLDLYGRNR